MSGDGWLKGYLEFYSETGTEGGAWAFTDDRFSHGIDFDCGLSSCPTKVRYTEGARAGQVVSMTHASYEGLYVLRTGDELRIHQPDRDEWIEVGTLDFPDRQDPYAPDAYAVFGALAAHRRPPASVNVEEWELWFLDGWEAEIRVADGSFPRVDPATIWEPRQEQPRKSS